MLEIRLIDANAFFNQFGDYYAEEGPEHGFIGTVGDLIIMQPTVNAEPVRYGQWIVKDSKTAKCSCCGWWQRTTMYFLPDDIISFSGCYRFCTACGARMDCR